MGKQLQSPLKPVTKIVRLPIEEVRFDGGTQMRARLDENYIQDLVAVLKRGTNLPPVVCFYDGEDYWLADGFNRFHAHLEIHAEQILVEVHKGTLDDAVFFAAGCNQKHGQRLTVDDKRNAVLMLLRSDHWGNLGIQQIASHVSIRKEYALRIRQGYDASRKAEQLSPLQEQVDQLLDQEVGEKAERGAENEAAAKTGKQPAPPTVPTSDEPPTKVMRRGGKPYPRSMPKPDPTTPADALGNVLPQKLRAVFAKLTEFRSLVQSYGRITGKVRKLVDDDSGAGRAIDIANIEGKLLAIKEAISISAPYCVCPACKGSGCDQCKKSGWLSKFAYGLIPTEKNWPATGH